MADRDIQLVIRAKDQAKKAIDSVADALRDLTDVQKDVGQSAAKTDGLLGRLKDELSALDKEARGLAALNKVAGQLDKAAAAVGRLDAAAARAAGEQEKLGASVATAAANTAKLKAAADEAKTAYDKQKAAVTALTAEQRKDVAATTAARTARDALRTSMTESNAAVKAAERQEAALQRQLVDAAQATEVQSKALAEANGELNEIAALANKASAALGGVEATQTAVAAASARAAGDMERLNRVLAQQSGSQASSRAAPTNAAESAAVYRQQVAAVDAAKIAWREAQVEANKLGTAVRNTAQPTREMQTNFLLAQAASRAAKQEYLAQGAALNNLRGDLATARTAAQQMNAETQKTVGVTTQAAAAQRQFRPAAQASGAAMSAVAGQTFRLRDAFSGVYGESRQAMNMFQRVRAEVLSLASAYVGLYAAINGIGTVISTMRAVEQAQNRLGVAFNQNQAIVNSEMTWLEEQAGRLKMRFADLAAEYGKFAFSAKNAGLALEDIHTIFLGVAEGARVMGLSAEEVGGILKALDQIMSKGKVQAEELRGQLGDRLSGSFRLFADAIGVTTAELDKMMEQGEVVASRSNMVSFGQKLRDTFGPQLQTALESTTAEISDFGANMQNAARQVGEGGLWDGLGKALADLNEWFKSDDGEKFFTSIGIALGKLAGVIPALLTNLDKIMLLFQVFATLKTSQVIMGLMGNMRGLSLNMVKARADVIGLTVGLHALSVTSSGATRMALTGLASTMVGLRGVMIGLAAAARTLWTAIGGLPGLVITALTFVVTSLVGKWMTSIDQATENLSEHERIVGRVTDAYVRAKGEVDDWKKALEDLTATEIELNTAKLQGQLADARKDALSALIDSTTGTIDFFTKGGERAAFDNLVMQFRRGEISAQDFKTAVDRIAQANPNLDRGLIEPLLKSASAAADAERAIEKNNAALRVKRGVATEADKALLGLSDALDAVSTSADTSAIDAYTAALKKLGEAVPDMAAQMKFTDSRADIEKQTQAAVDALGLTGYSVESALGQARAAGNQDLITKLTAVLETRNKALEALVNEQTTAGGRSYIDKLGQAEGTARNPMSSAVGFGQFTDSTWATMFQQAFPARFASLSREAMLALKKDPQLARTMTELLTEQNAAILAGAGFAATDTNKYLAHFLGAGRAVDVLKAAPNTPIEQLTGADQRAANPNVFKNIRTASDMIDWSAGKMGVSDTQVQAQRQVVDLLAEARKKQAEFNAEIATGITQREFEIAQLGRTEKEQQVQLALRQAQTKAMQDSTVFSDEQAASIRKSTEALYDAEGAERGRQAILEANTELLRTQGVVQTRAEFIAAGLADKKIDATTEYGKELAHVLGLTYDLTAAEAARKKQQEGLENNISTLEAQQSLIMQQIETAQTLGDNTAVAELRTQLQGLNADLLVAYNAMIKFWQAQDPATNPNAAAAVANLQRAKSALQATGTTAVVTGRQINESIASGGAAAFDRFAQAVAEGKNAWDSFRDAFLQFASDFLREIAQMILKAAILKAISGGSPDGGIGGAIANGINSLFRHNGGMAGSGGGYKSVWAGHFANATRYHTGGIVGLKPNEIPIVAERGEEVLDAGDPRHRENGGMMGGNTNLKNVNVFDASDMLKYALADELGQKVFFNFVRDNSRAFQGALAT